MHVVEMSSYMCVVLAHVMHIYGICDVCIVVYISCSVYTWCKYISVCIWHYSICIVMFVVYVVCDISNCSMYMIFACECVLSVYV